MKFTPRMEAPSTTNKYWLRKTHGGVNPCIEIKNGSVLANCVGYAFGRVYELLGKKPNLSTGNANGSNGTGMIATNVAYMESLIGFCI